MATKRLGNQHIQVFVRCRPPTASEKRDGSARAIEVDQERKEIRVNDRVMPDRTPRKSFLFDKDRRVQGSHGAHHSRGHDGLQLHSLYEYTEEIQRLQRDPAATRYRNRISWTSSTIEWPESTTHRIASIFFWIIDRVSVIQSCELSGDEVARDDVAELERWGQEQMKKGVSTAPVAAVPTPEEQCVKTQALTDLEVSAETTTQLHQEQPKLETNFRFFQEMQSYAADLIECLDAKILVILALEGRMMSRLCQRSEKLVQRRHQDIKDQAEDCNIAECADARLMRPSIKA
ncbi:hypothetical protein MRX96_013533 [Rhipicephalus microplus]